MITAKDLRDKLSCGRHRCACSSRGNTHCPAHDDPTPSLSIKDTDDGTVIMKCHAGCSFDSICDALGIEMKDLFPNKANYSNKGGGSMTTSDTVTHLQICNIDSLAKYLKLPVEALKQYGCTNGKNTEAWVNIPYLDIKGQKIGTKQRRRLKSGNSKFTWANKAKAGLYGMDRYDQIQKQKTVTIVEGESDCWTLWHHGFIALGVANGASSITKYWDQDITEKMVSDLERINVVIECDENGKPDKGGEAFHKWIETLPEVTQNKIYIIDRLQMQAKDPNEMYQNDSSTFSERWKEALDNALKWSVLHSQEVKEQIEALAVDGLPLLKDPNLMDQLRTTIRKSQYAGDTQPVELAVIAMTSRLLSDPINLVFVAESATGKSYAVKTAMRFIPEEEIYAPTTVSPYSIIYRDDERCFMHKVISISEADSMPLGNYDDGTAASYLRDLSMLSAGEYAMHEPYVSDNGVGTTKAYRKYAPISLITTSTRSLPKQMNTRCIEVPISDSSESTRLIITAQAQKAAGLTEDMPDYKGWHAMQELLRLGGNTNIIIPYAEELSHLTDVSVSRMNRDFGQLLNVIRTFAFIHQHQREIQNGNVIANHRDYEMTYELLKDIFGGELTVSDAVRRVVEKIYTGETKTSKEIADRLHMNVDRIRYGLKKAEEGNYLINSAMKHERAIWSLGDPLPNDRAVIPSPADLFPEMYKSGNDSGLQVHPPQVQSSF